jgi:predicted ATPase
MATPATLGHPSLPASLTPLVGREDEIAAVATLIQREGARLVTLTGAGGVRKTRFALAVAGEIAAAFPDGAAFVGLAPVAEPTFVTSAIAQALSVREVASESLANRIVTFLRDKRFLLLLDNFEHLLLAAPGVTTLLVACPRLTVLATSRERLRLSGEH